jgi:hypothetical protein
MPLRPADRLTIRDPASGAILARRWTFASERDRASAADALLANVSDEAGLLRYSLYRGLEDLTLLQVSHWSDTAHSERYLQSRTAAMPAGVEVQGPERPVDWSHSCQLYRSYVRATEEPAGCLVVVRQPLVRADQAVAREWVDGVCAALDSQAPDGLGAASFFVSVTGDVVLNLAEWKSADAHRVALKSADFGQYGSIGDSEAWRKARLHPGITRDHDVRRYALLAAAEPWFS